jgi:hypothetical protein
MSNVRRLMNTHEFGGKWLADLNDDLRGSDRSCAVLAGAVLDDRVKQLLLAYLLPPKKQTEDRLLGRSGALESFSSRIELSGRLNLITENTRKALDWVRDIRNEAAHNSTFAFGDSSNHDRVTNIVKALELKKRAPDLLKPPYEGPKGEFVAAVVVLMTGLELETLEMKRTAHQPIDAVNTATFTPRDA